MAERVDTGVSFEEDDHRVIISYFLRFNSALATFVCLFFDHIMSAVNQRITD
jgi:hypothetical protein